MQILDYERDRVLNDVGIVLTREEALELMLYLHQLVEHPEVQRVYLSEVQGSGLERELTIALAERPVSARRAAISL